MGAYPYNYDYSSQTQISPSNVAQVGLIWAFGIPAAPRTITPRGVLIGQGSIVTPLIIGGITYSITNFQLLVALNAANGKIIWTKDLTTLNAPNIISGGVKGNITQAGHYHAFYYTDHMKSFTTPLIWVPCGTQCIEAFNAYTGDLVASFNPNFGNPDPSVQHSLGNYGTNCLSNHVGSDFAHDWLAIDENSGVLVVGNGASEGTDSCRGMFVGLNITNTLMANSPQTAPAPTLLWRVFTIPPQDGSDPNWTISDINNMTHAWVFNPANNTAIDLKAWEAADPTAFHAFAYDDWAGPGGKQFAYNGTLSFAGSASGWGGAWAVDPNTHMAYVGTAQASPDLNATSRMGPDLWSDSVLAIDTQTGKLVWAFQTTSHDLYDWDCSWGFILANVNVNGQSQQVVMKACKDGKFFELNAQTGALVWSFTAPSLKFAQYTNPDVFNVPTNQTDMRVHNWADYPSKNGYLMNPAGTGGIESNPAFDPTTNEAFVATYNWPNPACASDTIPPGGAYFNGQPFGNSGGAGCQGPGAGTPAKPVTKAGDTLNSTLWAVNASTGAPVCSYPIADIGYRGGVSVTNGMVIVPRSDGFIDFVSETTCQKITSFFVDGALVTQMAIGEDVAGNVRLIMPASGAVGSPILGFFGYPTQPGYIFALGLPASATQTLTTQPSGIIQTTTVTTSVTTSGIDPSTFYGVVGVAVVFIIATGFLAVRLGRKPPS